MATPNYLSWQNFASTVLVPGQQRVHRVTDSPEVEIFGDGDSNRVGLWLEVPQGTAIPLELLNLSSMTSRTLERNGKHMFEIGTSIPSLHRQFYHFAVAVAERVVVDKHTAAAALVLELQSFTDLLEGAPLLGIEKQLGLLGELIFLEHLTGRLGILALDAWLGPTGEPHDFRNLKREFEVKTSSGTRRIHTIHGMEQLIPSEGCSLSLISVLLGPPGAGAGFSLDSKVTALATYFADSPAHLVRFKAALRASGFREEHRFHYARLFVLRRPLGLVKVDDKFPSITRLTIQNALGVLAPRVDALQYDVDLEGLEIEATTTEFDSAIYK